MKKTGLRLLVLLSCLLAVYLGYHAMAQKPVLEVVEVSHTHDGAVAKVRITNDTQQPFTYFGTLPKNMPFSLRAGGETLHQCDPMLYGTSCVAEKSNTLAPGERIEFECLLATLLPDEPPTGLASLGMHLIPGTAESFGQQAVKSHFWRDWYYQARRYLSPQAQMYEPVWSEPFMLPAPAKAAVVSGR